MSCSCARPKAQNRVLASGTHEGGGGVSGTEPVYATGGKALGMSELDCVVHDVKLPPAHHNADPDTDTHPEKGMTLVGRTRIAMVSDGSLSEYSDCPRYL